MRFARSKGLAATAALLLGFGVAGVGAAPVAQATTTSYCTNQAAIDYQGHAWNNWNGNAGTGNPINYYDSTTTNNSQWCMVVVGNVSDGTNGVIWPFVDGSGLNTRYNGDPVFEIKWGPNQNWCADGGNFQTGTGPQIDDGENDLDACGSPQKSDSQWYVYSAYHYFANVYTNNESYTVYGSNYVPELVGDAYQGDGNGGSVFNDYNDTLPMSCTNSSAC